MKLTVETEPLTRMLKMLKQGQRRGHRQFRTIQLRAAGNTLAIEQGELVAKLGALVWSEGSCTVSLERFLAALPEPPGSDTVDLQLGRNRLRVGAFSLSAVPAMPEVQTASSCRIVFASDFGMVSQISQHLSPPVSQLLAG